MTIAKTTDAVLAINDLTGTIDFAVDSSGDILTEDFFDTAILMSIFAERRAIASEMPESRRRRGWIGNESTPDFEIGSKLWLYEQERLTRSVLNGIETVVQEGLSWLVDDLIANSTSVTASIGNPSIRLEISIKRDYSKVEKRFFELWENSGITNVTIISPASAEFDNARITSGNQVRVTSDGNVRSVAL